MWRLSVLFLILSSVSTQFSGYLTNKAFTEEFCYNFFTNWENTEKVPGHAQVILSKCEKGEVIRIDKAEFIRPDSRGDDCGTTQTCCPATEDDCQQDIEQSYETLYQSIRNNCDEHNGCHINVPAFKTDSECGGYFIWSKCRTKTGANFDIDTSCYPRRIKIYYACLYRGDVIPPTKTVTIATTKLPITARTTVKSAGPEETDSTTQLNTLTEAVVKRENNSQTDERRVGLIVGIALGASVMLIVVIVTVVVICRRTCYKTKKFPPPMPSGLSPGEQIDPEYANQISQWDEPPPETEENALMQNKEPDNTYDRIKGKPTSIDYMLMTNVKSRKPKPNSTSAIRPEEETNLSEGDDRVDVADLDYVRCDKVDKEQNELDGKSVDKDAGLDESQVNADIDKSETDEMKDRTYYNQLDLKTDSKPPVKKLGSVPLMKDNSLYESEVERIDRSGDQQDLQLSASVNGLSHDADDSAYSKEQLPVVSGENSSNERMYTNDLPQTNEHVGQNSDGQHKLEVNGNYEYEKEQVPVISGNAEESGETNHYENVEMENMKRELEGGSDVSDKVREGEKGDRNSSEDYYDKVKIMPENGNLPMNRKGEGHYENLHGRSPVERREA